jgi:hypothetical protein
MVDEGSASDSNNESVLELIEELVPALAGLQSRLDHFRLRQWEYAGDLTLYGFLRGTWESASATLFLVRQTDFAAAAYPCVRAAFEAAEDALLLATEANFSAAGARARVFERLEHADLKSEMHDAFADPGTEEPARDYSEAVASVEKDAARWNRDCPGRGQLLLEALAHFLPMFRAAKNGGRHPAHWSELSRRKMAVEIGRRVGEPSFGASLIATYAQLSRASHPRFRIESWEKYRSAKGQQRYRRHPRESRIVLGVATLATKTAAMAFDRLRNDDQSPRGE